MANLYDKPIPIDISIDSYALPTDLIDKSLTKQQDNFNTVLKTYDDNLNQILSITGRPGNKSDEDMVRGLYDEAKPKALDVMARAEGSYSNLTSRNLQEEFEKILIPKRELITGLTRAKEVYGERKALENAEAQGKAVLLRFNDDVLTKPIANEDGTINNFEAGAESKLDWYGGIGKLFKDMTTNKFIKETLGNVEDEQLGIATIKKWMFEMETFGHITDAQGNVDNRFTNVLKNIIEGQIDSFITNTNEGIQMNKWFKHQYAKRYKEANPNATLEEIDQYATEQAREEVKDHIKSYGEKFKGQSIKEAESTQVVRLPKETDGNSTNPGEEAGDGIQVNFADVVDRGFVGADISGMDIEKEYDRTNEDYVRFAYQVTDDPSQMVSLKQIQEFGSQIGPYDSQQKLTTLEGHQFEKRNSNTRGILQKIGDAETGGDPAKLNKHPTVFELNGKNNIIAYKDYLERNGKKHTQEYRDLEKLLNEKTNPSLQNKFFTSLVIFEENELGQLEPVINPFFKELAGKDPKVQERITRSETWLAKPAVNEQILRYTIPYTKMKDLRRSLWETMDSAAKKAGFSSVNSMNAELRNKNNNIGKVYSESNDVYYDALLDIIMKRQAYADRDTPITTSALRSLFMSSKQDIITSIGAQPGNKDNLNMFRSLDPALSQKIGYALMRDIDNVIKNPDVNHYILGKKATIDDVKRKYKDIIEQTIKKPIDQVFSTPVLRAELEKLYVDIYRMYSLTDPDDEKSKFNTLESINFAKSQKEKYLQSRVKDSRFLTYFDELEQKGNDFYIEGYTHVLSDQGNIKHKEILGSLETLVQMASSHFKVLPDKSGNDLRTAYTFREVIESTLEPKLQGKEKEDAYNAAMASLKLIGLTYDLNDGIVLDYTIKGIKFEIRPRSEQIPAYLALNRNADSGDLDLFKQITQTLKENNNTMGYLGDPKFKSKQTQFFMHQQDSPQGKKGEFYIYEDGRKRTFKSAKELMNWHNTNKRENYIAFQKAGTLLAMPEAEFKQAYPNTNREEVVKYYNELFQQDIEATGLSQIAHKTGYQVEDLTVVPITENKSKITLKPPIDDNKVIDDKYVTVVDGKRQLKYETVMTGSGLSNKYPDDPVLTIGPLKEALIDLGSIMSNAGSPPLVISNSLRDIQEMEKLYANDPNFSKGANSAHLEGMAVDIRVSDVAGQNAVKWFKSTAGQKWLKENDLAVLVHKIKGNLDHIHLQYNKKLGKSNILDYVFEDERDGTKIK
jgi:hypothetical protein